LGSQKVLARLQKEIEEHELDLSIEVVGTGCPGFCECGPLVTIYPERISYQKVRLEDVPGHRQRTLLSGEIIERLLYTDPLTGEHIHKEEDLPFYRKQVQVHPRIERRDRPDPDRGLRGPGRLLARW
jgi:(2Fe-2S) ferredoxin